MIQKEFAEHTVSIFQHDESVTGLAAGGSWISNEMDEFSDLDLIVVTKHQVAGDKNQMLSYAGRLGNLLTGFTGEHVGEPRVLICLFDDPLLHVDIKFLTLDEFRQRVETPVILLDKDEQLKNTLKQTESIFPYPDYQWIEDRFWTWIHYALLKIGRGEYMEAFDFFSSLRGMVLGPLLQIKNGNLPKGVRKVETQLGADDLESIVSTLPSYSKEGLLTALQNCMQLYRQLRRDLFPPEVDLKNGAEMAVIKYIEQISM